MIGNNFFIRVGATLPTLRMELINDGRYDFMKASHFNNAIQNATITFSMYDEHDVLKICNSECNLVLVDENTCDEKYIIEYRWKPRDTKKSGHYKGKITITFQDDIFEDGIVYDAGVLITPIYEELDIFIKE